MPLPRRMRSIAMALMILVPLGAAVNVAVAWGCASLSGLRPADSFASNVTFSYGEWLRQVEREAGFGRERLRLGGSLGPFRGDSVARPQGPAFSWRAPPEYAPLPAWSRLGAGLSSTLRMVGEEEATGWPLKSMWAAVVESRGQGWITRSSTAIHFSGWTTRKPDGTLHSRRLLPLRPIWPAFALNTLFFSVLLATLFYVPRLVRRAVRVKRGRCITCGYDLRGAAHARCPECGGRIASPASRPASTAEFARS